MSKIYKGWELMKAIADEEIKKGTKFKDKDGKEVEWNGDNFVFTNSRGSYMCTIDDIYFINDVFGVIETEIDIDKIQELYINSNKVGEDLTNSWIGRNLDIAMTRKINELVQAVKQIDKRVKKLEENK